jgi:hypothetical protein
MSTTLNKNFLSPNGFRLIIDRQEFADVEYFCINSALPTVSAASISQAYRNLQNTYAGDKVEYAPFDIRYMITENMENYISLFNWMVSNSNTEQMKYADMTLNILNSSNNVIRQVRFADAFPVSIGQLDFHSQNTDVEYIIGDASFSYSHFYFVS